MRKHLFIVLLATLMVSQISARTILTDFSGSVNSSVSYSASQKDSMTVYVEKIARQIPVGVTSGMKFSQYSKLYNPKDYTPSIFDRYSPGGAGVASFFIPGLGQALCGEWGRGILYFCCNMVCSFCWGYTLGSVAYYGTGAGWLVLSSICLLSVDILAIVDSVKVAKIKNMYQQDLLRLSSFEFKMKPYIAHNSFTKSVRNSSFPAVGLSLCLTF